MGKFLSVLMSLVLLAVTVPRGSFAQTDVCTVRDDCSCNCTCTKEENGSSLCKFPKDCPCLDARKGLFHYLTLPLRGAWSFLSNDAAAMWKALGQFTWYQNIFNVVALFFIGAMMFRD